MLFQNLRRGAQGIWFCCVGLGLMACGGSSGGAAIVVPGAPTLAAGTPDHANASVRIAFMPPASDGGAAITVYKATCTEAVQVPNGATATSPVVLWFGESANSPVTVTGLTRGASYTCTVTARNSAGTSAASAPVTIALVSS